MRPTILIVVALEALLLLIGLLNLALVGARSDAAGQGMAYAYAAIGAVAALLLMASAFALAYYNKLVWMALVLAILAGAVILAALAASL